MSQPDDPAAPPELPSERLPDFTAAATMLENRLKKNATHRQKWARRADVSCYRLYERDIPEIPLVIDWYEGRVHVAERARPNTDAMTAEAHAAWISAMTGAIARALGVAENLVYVKRRERQKGTRQYTALAQSGERFEVREGKAKLWVNLRDYLDTGLFLDHRPLRLRVGAESEGKRVLNLFCYTGAFSVHAALGGARSTTSVDLSPTYIEWARDNLKLNGLEQSKHRMVRADIVRWLQDPVVAADRYDLIVVDPPTFSNSARMEGVFDVQRDHADLLWRLGAILAPGGVLYFSTNFQRFKLDESALTGLVAADITRETIPEDFRDERIHRCWRFTKTARP
jgi:23S rRNA G2069 N7-methylase RlmK/C1962 C5-methylase RlmI